MKTLSKILIALCMLANVQALIAQEANTRCLSEDGDILTAEEQKTKGDPLCRFQWHLSGEGFVPHSSVDGEFDLNSSTKTKHLNVAAVWDEGYKGQGIYIAIVDTPIDIDHPDLEENIAIEYNHNYSNRSVGWHGTQVAGVAAARGYNGIGVRGVAPLAHVFGLSGDHNLKTTLNSFIRYSTITAVSNHSYAYSPFRNRLMRQHLAMETGINEGFYGKGTVYVLGAGNEGDQGDNANYESLKNYHAGVTVCGVDYRGKYDGYSDPGANLWVCALNNQLSTRERLGKYGIVTTTLNRYTIHATGTSYSTSMVSGIVALMRQANRNLGWRDVKLILADSARKTDPDDKGWGQSGMKYGSFDKHYHFNHLYGFGLVDAKAAVDLAKEWVNLPPREEDTIVEKEFNPISRKEISKSLIVESDIDFIEHVDATIDFNISDFYDLSIELISPSGTTSILAAAFDKSGSRYNDEWRFGSSRHLGEPASGEWRLIARNARAGNTITLRSWELRIRGYQVKLEAVATENLSDLNQAEPPLTLSLHGALWKETLKPSDFRLQNAPSNLSITSVERTSSTQVQLKLELTDGKLDDDYDFQVVATTGTVSNHPTSLISNAIEIARIAHNKEAVIPQGTVGFNYVFTAEDILISPTTLSYTIELVNENGNGVELEGTGFMLNAPTISGSPQVLGTYRFKITATREHDKISRTEYITLNVQPPHTVQTQIKVYPEGLLSE